MTDWVLIIIAVIACYAFVAYLEHRKKIDLIDRGLWKPEEKQERPEHKLITGLFFFLLGVALFVGSYFVEPDLVSGLRISALLTIAAGAALLIAYTIGKKTLAPS
jgi:VIT1/CCC1 family predicted Fe2+/Mn2+ transporter